MIIDSIFKSEMIKFFWCMSSLCFHERINTIYFEDLFFELGIKENDDKSIIFNKLDNVFTADNSGDFFVFLDAYPSYSYPDYLFYDNRNNTIKRYALKYEFCNSYISTIIAEYVDYLKNSCYIYSISSVNAHSSTNIIIPLLQQPEQEFCASKDKNLHFLIKKSYFNNPDIFIDYGSDLIITKYKICPSDIASESIGTVSFHIGQPLLNGFIEQLDFELKTKIYELFDKYGIQY